MIDSGTAYIYTADLVLLETRAVNLAWAPSELSYLKALPLRAAQMDDPLTLAPYTEQKAKLVCALRTPAGGWEAIYKMEVRP